MPLYSGIRSDPPLLQRLEGDEGVAVGDAALDRDALLLDHRRHHLGEDHVLGEVLGADVQRIDLLLAAADQQEQGQEGDAQGRPQRAGHGRSPRRHHSAAADAGAAADRPPAAGKRSSRSARMKPTTCSSTMKV